MNECIVITIKDKLVLALKLIDFYSKKIQRNDYTQEILEYLVVSNFSSSNPHVCQIKTNSQRQMEGS